MRHAGSVEYALARVAARFCARPTEFEWRRIEIVRGAAALLDAARMIPAFAPWLGGLTADLDVHAAEARLRARWRTVVAEVERWMPPEWQPAIAWCAPLPDLPVLAHLFRGGDATPWIARDDALGPLVRPEGAAGMRRALAESGIAPLAAALDEPQRLHESWLAEWRRRLPRLGEDDRMWLARLATMLARHRDAFARTAASDGWPLRRALTGVLESCYHRSAGSPVAALAFLAVVALDGERLRGEVVRRIAFPRLPLAA